MARKQPYLFLCLTLVAYLAATSSITHARIWIGPHVGFKRMLNTDVDKRGGAGPDYTVHLFRFQADSNIYTGLTVGYDFVKEGALGYDWPEWAKYFSVALDFSYTRILIDDQLPLATNGISRRVKFEPGAISPMFFLSFLFMAKYGFFPDDAVPFGRLQPYLALGPGLIFSTLDMSNTRVGVPPRNDALGQAGSVNLALVTEAGLRYFLFTPLSLDAAFRYSYARLGYSYSVSGGTVSLGFDAHLINVLLRLCYHF